MNRIKRLLLDSSYRKLVILHKFSYILPDKVYLKLHYKIMIGKRLNLSNPVTFNEKLQWLKIYDRNPLYTSLVDKYEVKSYVSTKVGEQYVIPTYGVWNEYDEIDFKSLPNRFVLKTTHGGGGFGVYVCKDKSTVNLELLKHRMLKAQQQNAFLYNREWPYKNIKKRFIAEELIVSQDGGDIKDYKFFCFNGKAKFMKIDFNRFSSHQANYYDMNFNILPFGEQHCPPDYQQTINKPHHWDKMIEIAESLSRGIPFARIDLYNNDDRIYFGEITFYPASGFGLFDPDDWDAKIGKMLDLTTVRSYK